MKTAKKYNPDLILHGNLIHAILSLAIPVVINSFLQTMYNLTDTYWLGKIGHGAAGGDQSGNADAEYHHEFRQRDHGGRSSSHCTVYRCGRKRGCQIHGKSDIYLWPWGLR